MHETLAHKLKVVSINPKVFALLVNVERHGNYLYVGVNNSLEEAYSNAVGEISQKHDIDPKTVNMDINMWNAIDGRSVLEKLTGKVNLISRREKAVVFHNVDECTKTIDEARNVLMRHLITIGDMDLIEKNKKYLGSRSYRYVKEKSVGEKVSSAD